MKRRKWSQDDMDHLGSRVNHLFERISAVEDRTKHLEKPHVHWELEGVERRTEKLEGYVSNHRHALTLLDEGEGGIRELIKRTEKLERVDTTFAKEQGRLFDRLGEMNQAQIGLEKKWDAVAEWEYNHMKKYHPLEPELEPGKSKTGYALTDAMKFASLTPKQEKVIVECLQAEMNRNILEKEACGTCHWAWRREGQDGVIMCCEHTALTYRSPSHDACPEYYKRRITEEG